MSSRRGAGEENILAMLERDAARRMSTRMTGARLASYGAAAALAGMLVGGVAWLAYDRHTGAQELQAVQDVGTPQVVPPMPEAVQPPQAPPTLAVADAATHPPQAPRSVGIVDDAARKRGAASPDSAAVPPLVMLPPEELRGAKPAPAARPAQDKVQTRPVVAGKPDTARPLARLEKKAGKESKVASRAAKSKQAQSRGAGQPKATATSSAAAQARKSTPIADAPVDSDVALISAIIAHAERHRGESTCSGAKCSPKQSRP